MHDLLCTCGWVKHQQNVSHQIVLCLNTPKINHEGSEPGSLNQPDYWVMLKWAASVLLAAVTLLAGKVAEIPCIWPRAQGTSQKRDRKNVRSRRCTARCCLVGKTWPLYSWAQPEWACTRSGSYVNIPKGSVSWMHYEWQERREHEESMAASWGKWEGWAELLRMGREELGVHMFKMHDLHVWNCQRIRDSFEKLLCGVPKMTSVVKSTSCSSRGSHRENTHTHKHK